MLLIEKYFTDTQTVHFGVTARVNSVNTVGISTAVFAAIAEPGMVCFTLKYPTGLPRACEAVGSKLSNKFCHWHSTLSQKREKNLPDLLSFSVSLCCRAGLW